MPGIVHLGIGNFHRAHQAWYTQRANALGGDAWHITGVSLRRPTMRDAMEPQDYRYTLVIKSRDATRYERMKIHDTILVASEDREAVVARIADPRTAIVTLTVTEKGYHIDGETGRLNAASPEIAAEIAASVPRSAVGFLVHGLRARQADHGEPLTVICCDNLAGNGRVLQSLVHDYMAAAAIDLTGYLAERVAFPNTMVDRIVPATSDALRDEVQRETGFSDASPVSTEAFSEWVIEDRFAGSRPAWDAVGVTIVKDVVPFELRKLRLLNGAHSLLACAGLMAGHRYVHEAIADRAIRERVDRLMAEAATTLPSSVQDSASAYCDALIDRFANPALNHELAQIAADGSIKLSVRILPVLSALEASGGELEAKEAVAFWLAFILRQLEAGREVADPKSERFVRIYAEAGSQQAAAKDVLSCLDPTLVADKFVERALDILSR